MSDSQASSVPETPTPGGSLNIVEWTALLPAQEPTGPPLSLQVDGLLFERQERQASVRRGSKVSRIWALGSWYTAHDGTRLQEAWRCSRCSKFIRLFGGSSSNASQHWRTQHNDSQAVGKSPAATPHRQMTQRRLYKDVNIDSWRANLLRWIVNDHVPFSQVNSEWFRAILVGLHPPIEPYLVDCRTVRRWLDDEFNEAVDQVRLWLQEAGSRIHISFDIWTSPNGFAMLGVYAHFVSGFAPEVREVLLALRRLEGGYSGEEVGYLLADVIRFWQLESRLGVFVADNVEVNDTTVAWVIRELGLPVAGKRRSRCLGHIVNLAAKAFLFGEDTEGFEAAVGGDFVVESSAAQKAQEAWRKKGPIGKVHNLVVYVRSSTLRREAFSRKVVAIEEGWDDINCLELRPDNATCWNSTYEMLERALKLEDRIRLFAQDPNYRRDLAQDTPTDKEWEHLREVADALQPFRNATLRSQGTGRQGHHSSIWEALPTLEYLLKAMEAGVPPEGTKRPTPLQIAHQNAWQKLRKYYNLTDACHEIYAAGLLFHPSYRRAYFDISWTTKEMQEYKELMLKTVKSVWSDQYCKNVAKYQSDEEEGSAPKRQKRQYSPDAIEKHLIATFAKEESAADDEFDSYISGARLNPKEVINIISWWTNRDTLTTPLQQQALDVLSIPAMSTACERLFSSAKDLVGFTRYSLHEDTMEALELLRQWQRAGIIAIGSGSGSDARN